MKPNHARKMRQFVVTVVAIAITTLGAALNRASTLGMPPQSAVYYVLSEATPLSMGTYTVLVQLVFFLGQWVLLGKDFKAERLLQMVAASSFGFFLDIFIFLLGDFWPQDLVVRWITLLIATVISGFGVAMQVLANFALMPIEGFVKVVSDKRGFNFGNLKSIVDLSFAATGIILSLIFFGKSIAVREGTLAAAAIFGQIIKFFMPKLAGVTRWIDNSKAFESHQA